MKKPKFSLTRYKDNFQEIVEITDHKTLAVWAVGCAVRVLHYYEEEYPKDYRPRSAIETLK